MTKRRKRKRSIIVRLLVLGISVYMVATLIGLSGQLSESNMELERLKAQKAAEEIKIEELKALLDSGSHEEIIEKAARERLGFVYSDEEIYIDISGN